MTENKETGKIIPFPGLAERLVDKGMDALAHKKFKEAVELLTKALDMKNDDYNARFGLVVALIELGQYREAKEHCQSLLKRGIGDYFKVMEMYVMILLQLNEYEEMEATVKVLLDEGYVPADKEEQFENMLEFSQRMSRERKDFPVELEPADDESRDLQLATKSYQEQLIILTRIKDENIRKYIDEIKDYLQSPEGHPYVKTVLLHILKEQDYQEECDIEKFLKHKTVIPVQLEDIPTRPFLLKVRSLIEGNLEHQNPTLFELTSQLIERQHFMIFPFEPVTDLESWAAAYHIIAERYQGFEPGEDAIIDLYQAKNTKVQEALQFITYIEEISSI